MFLTTSDKYYGDRLVKIILFSDCYSFSNPDKIRRYFVVNTSGNWNIVPAESLNVLDDQVEEFVNSMTTNIQILTNEEEVIQATLDPEKRIIAAYQNIRRIPYALVDNYGHWVEILDLSHNQIRKVEELDTAFRLHTLILDHNLISSDAFFPWMPQLKILWLNNNLIFRLEDFIPALSRACPNLVYLSLMGNAAVSNEVTGGSELQQSRYRHYVISHFDNLRHLDDKPVTTIERLRCKNQRSGIRENLLDFYYDMKTLFRLNFTRSSCVV